MNEINLKNLLKKCDITTAMKIIECLPKDAHIIAGYLWDIGISEHNITAYFCAAKIAEMATENEVKATFHHVASVVLTNGLVYVDGSYDLGFFHEMRAIELSPRNVQYLSYLLSVYSDCPDFEMDKRVEAEMVQVLLALEPQNEVALRVSKRL